RRVEPAAPFTVAVVYVVNDELLAPVPARRLPGLRVVPDELSRDVDRLGQPDYSPVVVPDADLGLGEHPLPPLHALEGKLKLVLRSRQVRPGGVEADGLEVHHIPDEHHRVTAVLVPQ